MVLSKIAKFTRRSRLKYPRRHLLYRAKQHARKFNREFNITLDDIPEIPEYCPVFPWIKISVHVGRGRGLRNLSSPSIDRIDCSKGYVKGNIRIISWRANCLRSNGTLKEFE